MHRIAPAGPSFLDAPCGYGVKAAAYARRMQSAGSLRAFGEPAILTRS